MGSRKATLGLSLWLALALPGWLFAGALGDFEDTVAKPKTSSSHAKQKCDADDSEDDSIFGDLFSGCFVEACEGCVVGVCRGVKWLVYDWWAGPEESPMAPGPAPETVPPSARFAESAEQGAANHVAVVPPAEDKFSSKNREANASAETNAVWSDDEAWLVHRPGTAGMPYVRLDYRWQYLENDLSANDFLLETGYKYAALYGRVTRYVDRTARESLNIEQYFGLLRVGGSEDASSAQTFQLGIGAGGYAIKGRQDQSGFALTVPIAYCPADWCGIEFRPAWTSINEKDISDYDLSISAGYRFIQLRTGYRWLWIKGEGHSWLDGPYAGVTAMF